mgnify:CR=1 FL=1|jgi:hypothetical protein
MLENHYSCSFTLPFKRDDVFREVASTTKPLGINDTKVVMSVLESWISRRPTSTVVARLCALAAGCMLALCIDSKHAIAYRLLAYA